ncbi:MAG: TlpA family protein disulfide reductase [Deltaproteobacteria bacterium]|nr:TlpA family protein disulfide reductase [Deltaproteobacteria bacterium]
MNVVPTDKAKRSLKILLILFIFFAAVIIIGSRFHDRGVRTGEVRGLDFALADLEGKRFRLSDHRGKPVLLIFSTTWCAYCRSEIPRFKNIYFRYAPLGLVIVNVNIQETRAKVARFAERYDLPYRVVLDEDGGVSMAYDILGVPSVILISPEGRILCRYCRYTEEMLDNLFKKKG